MILCADVPRKNTSLRTIPTLHTSRAYDRQTPPVCELISSTQTSVPLTKAKPGQAPSKKKPDGGLNEVAYSQPKATQKLPFRSLRVLSTHRDIKQNQTGELLWRDAGGIHWRIMASCSGPAKGYSAGYSAGLTGELLCGSHRWAALVGYSAGSTGELLWDTQRDPLVGCSGGILGGIHSGGILGGIHWRAARRDTRRDPLASRWDTRRDPLASSSGGILGGIHWRAALAGYSAGSTDELLWRDTWRDPLESCTGGILGGGVV